MARNRYFASLSKADLAKLGSKGGKTAHANGTAHRWTSAEAQAAGKKGGSVKHPGKGFGALQGRRKGSR